MCSLAEWSQEIKRRSPSRLLALLPILVIGRELSGAPETPTAVGHTRAPAAISLSPLPMELSRELVMDILSAFLQITASFPLRGWNNTSSCDERLSKIRTRENTGWEGAATLETPPRPRVSSVGLLMRPQALG